MKRLIALGFLVMSFVFLIIATAKPAYAGPCNRYLDTTKWECYTPPNGNCCDDVIIYG
ncbi:hypothetical protein ABRY23_05955 [Melioribacteraceae bacterium 4301-Me]|uniref:hypothetical protein n=1 Tax=Pyranulibacter aquaticus TaxID=3163344 RepID=UPI0035961948